MATVPLSPRSTRIDLASATAGPFEVGFRLFESDAVEVFVNGELREDWTMEFIPSDGYDDNATITFDADLSPGDVIFIDGDMDAVRSQDFTNGDPSLTQKANIELGRLWAVASEAKRRGERSLRGTTDLAPLEVQPGHLVGFDDSGNPISARNLDDFDADVSAASSSAAAASSSAQAAAGSAQAADQSAQAAADSEVAAASSEAHAAEKAALLGEWRGAWATATQYALGDRSRREGSTYICLIAHTSDDFDDDLAAERWELFAQRGSAGEGTGDMLAENNLSDVDDVAAARGNLGLGSAAVQASSAFQAVNANLTSLSGLTLSANKMLYATAANTLALTDLTSFARTLLDDADAAAARVTLGLGDLATGTKDSHRIPDPTDPEGDVAGTVTGEDLAAAASAFGGGGFANMEVFETSGTFVVPEGVDLAYVVVIGGGGGGGGINAPNDNESSASGAGGAGGVAQGFVDLSSESSVSVTVGAQGNGGHRFNNGQSGGTSSFLGFSADGGSGGNSQSTTGSGAVGNSGSGGSASAPGGVAVPGMPGGRGVDAGGSQSVVSGAGGSTPYGAGGSGRAPNGNGNNGTGYGSGGGGAASRDSAGNHLTGGNGTPGLVIVYY